jgi:outer membrane biosynthesis protein TonB
MVVEKGKVLDTSYFRVFRTYYTDRTIDLLDLSQAVFPNNEVPDSAFFRCEHLWGIKLPSTIKRIGRAAFESTNLKSIDLPPDLEVIEDGAFRICYNLSGAIYLQKKLHRIGSSSLVGNQLFGAFEGCMNLDTLIVHAFDLDSIGAMTFAYCTGLKGEIVLDKIKYLGTGAFTHTLLSRVEVGGLTYVGGYAPKLSHFEGAFENCKELRYPYLEDDDQGSPTLIEPHAFSHIHPQAHITLVLDETDSYSNIADDQQRINHLRGHTLALTAQQTLLSSIKAISSPNSIGRLLLTGMVNVEELAGLKAAVPQLRSLVLENAMLEDISQNAFTSGSLLRRIVFPSRLKTISGHPFDGTPLTGVLRLPHSLVRIEAENDKGIFEGNSGILHIVFPPTQPDGKDSTGFNLRKIGNRSFINMSGLSDTVHFKPNYWVSMARGAFTGSKVAVEYFKIDEATLLDPTRNEDTTALLKLEVKPYYFTGDLTLELTDSATGKAPVYVKIDSAHCSLVRDSVANKAVFSCPLILNNRKTYTVNYKFFYHTDRQPESLASGKLHFQYIKAESIRFEVAGKEGQGENVTVDINTAYTIRAIVTPANISYPQINWHVTGADWVTVPPSSCFEFVNNDVTVAKEGNNLVFSRKARIKDYDDTVYVNVSTPDGAAGARLLMRTDPRNFNLNIRNKAGQVDGICLATTGDTLDLEVYDPSLPSETDLPPVTWAIRTPDNLNDSYAGIFIPLTNSKRRLVIPPPARSDTSFRVNVSITGTNTTASLLVKVVTLIKEMKLSMPDKLTNVLQHKDEIFTIEAAIKPANASISSLVWAAADVLDPVVGEILEVKDTERDVLTYSRKYKVLRIDKKAVISATAVVSAMDNRYTWTADTCLEPSVPGLGLYPYSLWLEKDGMRLNDEFLTLYYGQEITLRAAMHQEEASPQWSISAQELVSLLPGNNGLSVTLRANTPANPLIKSVYAYLTVTVPAGPNGETLQHIQAIRITHRPITNLFLSVPAARDVPVTGIGEVSYDEHEQYGAIGLLSNLEPAAGATYPSYQWSIYPENCARSSDDGHINETHHIPRYFEPLIPNREFTVSIRPVTDTSIVKGYSYTMRVGRAGHRNSIRFQGPDTIYMSRNQDTTLTVLSQIPSALTDREDLTPEDFYPLSWRFSRPAVGYWVGTPKAEIITRNVDNNPVRYIKYTHRVRAFLADSATMIIVRDSTQRVGGDTLYLSTHSPLKEALPVEQPPAAVAVQHIAILAQGEEISNIYLEPEATVELHAALTPPEATYTDVQWIVENPSVASIVEEEGLRALSEGPSCSLKVLRHDASTRVFAFSLDAATSTVLPSDTLIISTTPAPPPPVVETPPPPPVTPEDPVIPEPPAPPVTPEPPVIPEDPDPVAPQEPVLPEVPESPADPVPAPVPQPRPSFTYTISPDKAIFDRGDTITVSIGMNPLQELTIGWELFPDVAAHFLPAAFNSFSRSLRVDVDNTVISLFLSTDTVFTFVVAPYFPKPEVPPLPETPVDQPLTPQLPAIQTPAPTDDSSAPDDPPLSTLTAPVGDAPAVFYYAHTLRIANLEGYHILLSGVSGRIFFSEEALPSPDEYRYLPLPPGVYFLSALKDGRRETIKLVLK